MIARFEVDGRERFTFSRRPTSGSALAGYGRYLLFAATGLLLFWLIYRWGTQPDWTAALPPLLAELLILSEGALTLTFALLWAAFGWREYQESLRMTAVLPQFTLEELRSLSPAAFEKYVAALFRQQGYQVQHRGGAGDLGVDLELVHQDGRRAIAQCKRYQNNVGPDAVRELYGALIHERAFHAFLVTTGEITAAARAWAQKKPITLIDGKTLVDIVGRLQ